MSSPLVRLAKVPLGWAELYSRYWNLLVALKNGAVSSMREVACLGPLKMVRSRKSTLVVELSWVNLIVGWDWLRYLMNSLSSDGGPSQMHKMSSMYLNHRRGFFG